MKEVIRLFYPTRGGDDGQSSHVQYKDITDFAFDRQTGVVTFKTQKYGTITSNLFWTKKTLTDAQYAELGDEQEEKAPAPVAGNRQRRGW